MNSDIANSKAFKSYLKTEEGVRKLLLEGKRDPRKVRSHLQKVIDNSYLDGNFPLLKKFGCFEVPGGYNHDDFPGLLWDHEQFNKCDSTINLKDIENSSYVMKPGERFFVRAFGLAYPHELNAEICRRFLKRQFFSPVINSSFFPSLRGLMLFRMLYNKQIPKDMIFFSFNESAPVPKSDDGEMMPCLIRNKDGFDIRKVRFDGTNFSKYSKVVLLSFCK